MENIFEELKRTAGDKLPKHVGLVPDGNRRWARKSNLNIKLGHFAGYEKVKKILYNFFDAGIKYLTIYALSLENVKKRSKEELEDIYKIIKIAVDTVKNEKIVRDEKVRFNVIGRLWLLPPDVRKKIDELIEFTKEHNQRFINLCIMYDGQEEIVDAVKEIIKDGIKSEDIDRERIKNYLYTYDFPEVDFIIRTGMEDGARISGFLLWDASYAEFKFRNDFWPDYSEDMLLEDLKEYINRKRRKGE
jgi:tritrans,polycis-undecaprenyl-diphosphate synthase [geranylgeranyl-diphosphate specific]